MLLKAHVHIQRQIQTVVVLTSVSFVAQDAMLLKLWIGFQQLKELHYLGVVTKATIAPNHRVNKHPSTNIGFCL